MIINKFIEGLIPENHRVITKGTIIYLVILLIYWFSFDHIFAEYVNLDELIMLILFGDTFLLVSHFETQNLLKLYKRLPTSLNELFYHRLLKILFLPLLCITIMLILNFTLNNLITDRNLLIFVLFSIVIFAFVFYTDIKLSNYNKTYNHKMIYGFVQIIPFTMISIVITYLLTIDLVLFIKLLLIIGFYIISIGLSYQIFRNRLAV